MIAGSVFSIVWFIFGIIAVLTMLFLLGGKPEASMRPFLKWTHRIFGGLFTVSYIIIAITMIPKYQSNAPFLSESFSIHACLGVILFTLLLTKHYIVRFAKRYYPSLPYLGVTILVMAFPVVFFTGINNLILQVKGPHVAVESEEGPRIVSASIGRSLIRMKCARCHDLELLFRENKEEILWRITIERMMDHDKALIITDDQRDHLVGYLISG